MKNNSRNIEKNQPLIKIEQVESVKPLMICHHW